MPRVRKSVYDPSARSDLDWYARAVAVMKTRPATDPASWFYQAGIHGNNGSLYWSAASPLPPKQDLEAFWNQCQHRTWYFLPWHRMYLAFFEQIVLDIVTSLNGPVDWALPFWDYSDTSNPEALNIPPSFTSPDDSSNPLWFSDRNPEPLSPLHVNLSLLDETRQFTGDNIDLGGFGGPNTGFAHKGPQQGALEQGIHGLVHKHIGGAKDSAMGDINTAGLDPIFWLHHANIDRLWQVWLNTRVGRSNPSDPKWKNAGFEFHDKNRQIVKMTPAEVEDTQQVLSGYTYQGVPATVPPPPVAIPAHLAQLAMSAPAEVIAATDRAHNLSSAHHFLSLNFLPLPQRQVTLGKLTAQLAAAPPETRAYLQFANIIGTGTPPIYDVYLDATDESSCTDERYAGSLSMFGVVESSVADEHHNGSGLHYALDISNLLHRLRALPHWQDGQLQVRLVPARPLPEGTSVRIGQISLSVK